MPGIALIWKKTGARGWKRRQTNHGQEEEVFYRTSGGSKAMDESIRQLSFRVVKRRSCKNSFKSNGDVLKTLNKCPVEMSVSELKLLVT